MKHFGWSWVGAIRTNDDYGNNGMAAFTEQAERLGICLEYSVSFFRNDPKEKLQRVVDSIQASSSRVIVSFMSYMDLEVNTSTLLCPNENLPRTSVLQFVKVKKTLTQINAVTHTTRHTCVCRNILHTTYKVITAYNTST